MAAEKKDPSITDVLQTAALISIANNQEKARRLAKDPNDHSSLITDAAQAALIGGTVFSLIKMGPWLRQRPKLTACIAILISAFTLRWNIENSALMVIGLIAQAGLILSLAPFSCCFGLLGLLIFFVCNVSSWAVGLFTLCVFVEAYLSNDIPYSNTLNTKGFVKHILLVAIVALGLYVSFERPFVPESMIKKASY